MVKTAVILAAGFGSRLGHRTKLMPKGFLELQGKSLIVRSVENLLSFGIEKIYIGTGHLNEYYDRLAHEYPQIETIKSDKYETTSSMYTLYNMRHQLKEDFLLLESDLLYERNALGHLLKDPEDDIILGSGMTHSNDEVYIQTDAESHLVMMSKVADDLASRDAELVGISKVSQERYALMTRHFEALMTENPKIDYEYIFVKTTEDKPLAVKKIESLIWCEIDDESHLNRALSKILPMIGEKEDV